MRSGLSIEVNYRHLGIDAATAMGLARAVPEVWTEIYSSNFRVYNDTRLAEASVGRSREDLLSTASTLVASSRIATMGRGLGILAQDNRLRSVTNSQGSTAEDLLQELNSFRTVYFNRIMATAFQSDDSVARLHLAELRFDVAELQRRLAAYDDTLQELRKYQQAARTPDGSDGLSTQPFSDREQVQLGDGALTQIMQMSERASFADFVREVLRERQGTVFRISEIERELDLAGSSLEHEDGRGVAEVAAEVLDDITRQYIDLIGRSRTVLASRGGDFYEAAAGPMVLGQSLIDRRSLLMVGVAGFAGLILAILLALLWPAIRGVSRQRA